MSYTFHAVKEKGRSEGGEGEQREERWSRRGEMMTEIGR